MVGAAAQEESLQGRAVSTFSDLDDRPLIHTLIHSGPVLDGRGWWRAFAAVFVAAVLGVPAVVVLGGRFRSRDGQPDPPLRGAGRVQGLSASALGAASRASLETDRSDELSRRRGFSSALGRVTSNLDGVISRKESQRAKPAPALEKAASTIAHRTTTTTSSSTALMVPPAAPAPAAGVPADRCAAGSEAACLRRAGCRWFALSQPCHNCSQWLGDHVDVGPVTGCHAWDPVRYCHDTIYEPMRRRCLSRTGCSPSDPGLVEVVRQFQFALGRRDRGHPHPIRRTCDVWCSFYSNDCVGQPRAPNALRGTSYGGRFVPEEFLELPGKDQLFAGVPAVGQVFPFPRARSVCDIKSEDIGDRMARYLEENIREEHFSRMRQLGFNVVRLPLAYWNLIDLPPGETPDGPPEAKARWMNLQRMMPAKAYRKWIDRIFEYAGRAGIQVMPDLHSAPGGQSGNQCTGCDLGPTDAVFHLFPADGRPGRNVQLAVQAVEEMAKICSSRGEVCYGIELLNEPYEAHIHNALGDIHACVRVGAQACTGLQLLFDQRQLQDLLGLAKQLVQSARHRKAPPPHKNTSREALRAFYALGIKAARAHMDREQPIVVMDWPSWLAWWMDHGNFSYSDYGTVVFSTHFYKFPNPWTKQLRMAKADFRRDLARLKDFFLHSGHDIMVSEWALNSHGSGGGGDPFDYHGFVDWSVHQFDQLGIGSMIWNYDSRWSAWGPVAAERVGRSFVNWRSINSPQLP